MRKKVYASIVGLVLISNVYVLAQNFRLGIIAGLDVANAHVTNKPDLQGTDVRIYYPMIAYNINGLLQYKSSQLLGFSLEPGMILKGGKLKHSNDLNIKLTYIQLPVLADLNICKKASISLGPEFSYLISAKVKSLNFIDQYEERFEVSGNIGVKYIINEKFDIGLRYNHGLTNTSKITYVNEKGEIIGEAKEYNQYFQLSLRYKLKWF